MPKKKKYMVAVHEVHAVYYQVYAPNGKEAVEKVKVHLSPSQEAQHKDVEDTAYSEHLYNLDSKQWTFQEAVDE